MHGTFLVSQFLLEFTGEEAGMLTLDELEHAVVAKLKVAREPIERQSVRWIEARTIPAADFEPGWAPRKWRFDAPVQKAFDGCLNAANVKVVQAFLITDAIDRLPRRGDDVTMPFQHHDLIRVISTCETAEIELRNIMMPSRRPGCSMSSGLSD